MSPPPGYSNLRDDWSTDFLSTRPAIDEAMVPTIQVHASSEAVGTNLCPLQPSLLGGGSVEQHEETSSLVYCNAYDSDTPTTNWLYADSPISDNQNGTKEATNLGTPSEKFQDD